MPSRPAAALAGLVLLALAGCAGEAAPADEDGAAADSIAVPEVGVCRVLTPDDVALSSNASDPVDCATEHTAETYTVGTFPPGVAAGKKPTDPALGSWIFDTCRSRFEKFLGGEESTVLRSVLTWAWFRPTEAAWEKGARWYRCDVVGGDGQDGEYLSLPETAQGLLSGRPQDQWMTCADGDTVSESPKVACSEPHTWRAVTTIKLGDEEDPYPGDRLVQVRTRDFCSDSVGAWLNYPVDYEYGYTYFHRAEWKIGNRRSICWAKTDQ